MPKLAKGLTHIKSIRISFCFLQQFCFSFLQNKILEVIEKLGLEPMLLVKLRLSLTIKYFCFDSNNK
jgi:hypothetical protein